MKHTIKLGPAGVPMACQGSSIDAIKVISDMGLSAMEVEFVRGVKMSVATAEVLGKEAKKFGVGLSVHAPYYINLASEERSKIEASKKRIWDSLERGEAMGATVVVVHAGYYGKDRERAERMITNACIKMSEKITEKKWKIKLGLETTGRQSQWGTLSEILNLCKKAKKCIPVIDFSHIFARNGGNIDYSKILEMMKDYNYIHSHFSGINYSYVAEGKGNERNHEPIGKPDFKLLAKEIIKRKTNITIISESPILEKDSLKMKKTFESLGYKF